MNVPASASRQQTETPSTRSGAPGGAGGLRVGDAFRETRAGWLTLACVWVASAAYLGAQLRVGWVPADPGMLAQMASRVLRGQVPYRDFVEVYTGGLTYLNALALRLFGMNYFSLRIPLFLFFLAWMPSVYRIARRFAGPLGAALVTLLGVAWSVPNYPEAMPSWYNLFFATWGTLALLRYTESRRQRWLWIAGLCGGVSFLFKISGLYFVAAALLYFLYREQCRNREAAAGSRRSGWLYKLFATGGLLAFLTILTSLIVERPTAADAVNFALPSFCLVVFLLAKIWSEPSGPSPARFRRLFSVGLPFAVGFAIPVALFLGWFLREGALGAWAHGTFVLAGAHLLWGARNGMPVLATIVGLAPTILVLLVAADAPRAAGRAVRFGVPVAMAALLALCWRSVEIYSLVAFSVPLLVAFLALATPFSLSSMARDQEDGRARLFLVVAVAVLFALVQFPETMPLYFCYAAPLVALALLAVVASRKGYGRTALGSLAAFYLVFGVWLHTPGYFQMMRERPLQPVSLEAIDLPRAGELRVKRSEAREYERLIRLVRAHARSRYIYAGPDSPEVYFLSGEWNPTRTIWDFLGKDFLDVPARTARILEAIDEHGVNLVVIKEGQIDSGPLPASLIAALDAQFPRSARVGNFQVRWKPRP